MRLKLGAIPTIVISSPETARDILKVHDLQCCNRPSLNGPRRLSYNSLDIGFCPYGDYWREMRKFCVLELLSKKRLQSFQSIREQEVMSVIDFISQASLNKTPIDVSDMIFSLTAFTTCKIAFGRGFRGTKIDVGRFQDIMHEATSLLAGFSASDFFPYTGWLVDLLTGFHGRLEKIFHKFDEFYQQIIDQHVDTKRGTDEVEDVIDILLKLAEDDQADFGTLQITPNHIKAILMNLFLGGVDTTAITMTWAMAELVRNPDILKKVQHEVRACVGNRGRVTENDVEDLHYLKLIVKETLRLHPPAPLLGPRETMSAVKLNGFDIPNKTRILINAWGIGRDPSSWKSADEFIPERFQDSPIDYKGQYFQFLPFGSGRRGCAGMYMGVTMVELGLANLLYSFDWTVPNGMEDIDMEEGFGLTAHKKKPLILLPLLHHKEETDMVSN
uniref:Cytochrome P450 oxidase CYP71AS21 n=1 Tax=Polygala tenuifolia TaxID=355332 RepID=A0A3G5ANG4_9FABA|nr:cytochrome P450 oxidase CYP71AS21 [Polygala tenuifolia]